MMPNKIVNSSRTLSVFDFDGTLTYYDSFILFLQFTFGIYYFTYRLIKMVNPAIKYLCKQTTRDELKKTLIKTFLTGVDENWLKQKATEFCTQYWNKLIRPKGVSTIITELYSGAEVTICSASPTIVLQPWANKLKAKLIGTKLDVVSSKLTGRIVGRICRGEEKVARLKLTYGDLSRYHLRVWGDTKGDYELLAVAQEPYWRHFH